MDFNFEEFFKTNRTFVIAEIGQNHQGDLSLAKKLIRAAKDSGADCVKFQKTCLSEKFTRSALDASYLNSNSWGKTYGEHKAFLEFSRDEFYELQSFSKEIGILFSASAMDDVSLAFLAKMTLPFIKIGSGDANNFILIENAAKLGTPLIISTGMQNLETVKKIYQIVSTYHKNFALLHCVSAYPTPYQEINLEVIGLYQEAFPDVVIGYSGHELGIDVTLAAVALGAKIIERHITLDKTQKGSDHKCSLLPQELKKLITGIRNIEAAMGCPVKIRQQCEIPCWEKLGKSLVFSKNLPQKHQIERDDLKIKVSKPRGIDGSKIDDVIGQGHLSEVKLQEPIRFMRSHRESSMLSVALEDFSVVIVDIDTRRIVRKFVGHVAQLTDVTFSPDSRWLITASMDCSIRTWDIPSGQLVDQYATDAACISIDMSPTGEALATAHVDYLGIFLWTNRTLYQKITLKAISSDEEPPLVQLPEVLQEYQEIKEEDPVEPEFISPEQISKGLLTLSGLSTSRWQNLLNIDIIKARNKPKQPPKVPKAAPFFLPTISTLNDFQFDLNDALPREEGHDKLLMPEDLTNLTEFGKLLNNTKETDDFIPVIEKLKSMGPSMIVLEIHSLAPEAGGSVDVMLQFMKCIENILKSNKDFELAEAYMSVFLKTHGSLIAQKEVLRNFLQNLQSCHDVVWNRLQDKLLYTICVVQNLKTM